KESRRTGGRWHPPAYQTWSSHRVATFRRIAAPEGRGRTGDRARLGRSMHIALDAGIDQPVEAEPDDENRAQHVPPIDQRAHLGVPNRPRWIDLADRNLGGAIAELDQLHQQIDFELVAVEPGLVQVDPRIVQHRDPHRPVAVGALADPLAAE